MYRDNTLTPKEATRLCALGTLAQGPMRYGALAGAARDFIGHILGPSLELTGTSIELLKYEGLIEAVGGKGMEDDAELAITESGREELRTLLTANIRTEATELNKLVMTLKFRFLHLLDPDEQRAQADLLVEICSNELVRLIDLRERHVRDTGFLAEWLDHDIGTLKRRIAWLEDFRARLYAEVRVPMVRRRRRSAATR